MKKSLFITIEFPPDVGGVAAYISHLCDHLPSDKIFVLADAHGSSFNQYDIKQDYLISREHFYPQWSKLFFYAWRYILRYNIEYLLISHVLPLGYIAYIFKKVLKKKYVIFLHGMDLKLAQKNAWKKFLLYVILKNASSIVANSEFTKKEILNFKEELENKIQVIYPCPKINSYNHRPSDRLHRIYDNKKVLLTVSRLVERKGHKYVIRILPRLLKKYPHLVYVIAGTGIYRQELEAEVRKMKVMHAVEFTDFVEDEVLKNYFEVCDIFVMPTESKGADVEGLGIVFLEAGSFKKPSIGGYGGGVSEAIIDGETGYLVNPEDPEELYRRIDALLASEELCSKIGNKAYSRVEREFTWKHQAEKLKALLN